MSFGEHLEELRKVFIKCLISIAIGCVFGFFLANSVINLLNGPLVRAMNKYAQVNAVDRMLTRKGYVDPELIPWMEQENLIPRQQFIDPTVLVSALQAVIPDFAKHVDIDPYRFESRQFLPERLVELCSSLLEMNNQQDALAGRRIKLFGLLTPDEQADVRRIAQQSETTEQDAETIAQIFNRLTKEARLFELREFQEDVAEPESSWFSSFFPPNENYLAKMKALYQMAPDLTLARQLNRALLSKLFAGEMTELRVNLVPIELWENGDFQPQSLGVAETFMVWMKAGVLTGLTFAGPFVFYHLWTFVAAGLYPHEQKYVHMYLPISIALFIAGVLLAFVFVFDPVLDFLFSFNRQMGIAPQMRIADWLGFVMFLPLGFGIAFQLPLIMLFLNRIGLIQVSDYMGKWRIAIMTIFVISMFLTPSDPISMLLLAIPLSFLYFVGVGMCHWMPKSKNPFGEEEREYTPV
jgi:sec-independent protein translocase protein TatC